MAWEYKVVPAPAKGVKEKGVKTPEARFAHGLETLLNDMAWEDWEFFRAETLPSEERSGLTGSQTVWRHVLIFRRAAETQAEEDATEAPVALIEDKGEAEPTFRHTEAPDVPAEGETGEVTEADADVTDAVATTPDTPEPADPPDTPQTLGDRARASLGWRPGKPDAD